MSYPKKIFFNMRVIGFNYTKLHAERQPTQEQTKKITTNIEFIDVEKDAIDVIKEGEVIKVSFKYGVLYEPKNAEIGCEGAVLLLINKEMSKETIKLWKKKKIEDKLKLPLLNLILNKCTLKAFQLEEDLGLPTHLKLPSVSGTQNEPNT